MAVLDKSKRLRKQLGLFSVYSLATGTTLSAGFFLLPGLAAQQAGPAIVLAYLIAAVPLIPAALCLVELVTAMPRAGGTYYFLDRSMGPAVGTIGGIGTWLALTLKTAFALIGMGAYLSLFFPEIPITPLAIGLALLFGGLNLLGAKASGMFQVGLVVVLLGLLAWFLATGLPEVQTKHLEGFLDAGFDSILGTAGMVYISYVGVTNVASVSEEVKNPERNLPRGVFLAVATAVVIYGLGTLVMVGVLPSSTLHGDLTPVATAARAFAGHRGAIIVTIAAIIAFVSVANAGVLTSSRYPLAMSRDHLMPRFAGRLSKKGIPWAGVLISTGMIIAILVLFDPMRIAKLASAFQLILFALVCVAVVIMRESHLEAYDPGYKAPFYPYLQIVGILVPLALLLEMGWPTLVFSFGLIVVSVVWYVHYGRPRIHREGAVLHMFERLGRQRHDGLNTELRSILKEKGVRPSDPFAEIIAGAAYIEGTSGASFEQLTGEVARSLAEHMTEKAEIIEQEFLQGTRIGATPVTQGIALPHFRHRAVNRPLLAIVRAREGIHLEPGEAAWSEHSPEDPVHALFYLVSPEADPAQHLRLLAQIATHVEGENFMATWLAAEGEVDIKEMLLTDERLVVLHVRPGTHLAEWIGRPVKDLQLPRGCLIALIRRADEALIPQGDTELAANDRLTVIGEAKVVRQLYDRYVTGTLS